LNGVLAGSSITQVRDSIYLVNVTGRATAPERASIDTLRDLQLIGLGGQSVPLGAVATLRYEIEQPTIWRRSRLPTITLKASVLDTVQPKTIVDQLIRARAALDVAEANEATGGARRFDYRTRDHGPSSPSLAPVQESVNTFAIPVPLTLTTKETSTAPSSRSRRLCYGHHSTGVIDSGDMGIRPGSVPRPLERTAAYRATDGGHPA